MNNNLFTGEFINGRVDTKLQEYQEEW